MQEICGKVCYATKKDAATVVNAIMNGRRKHRPKRLRTYWCRSCGGHHLSKS